MMKRFRVAHIIDSLDAGGAEQMAVNFVNGLWSQEVFTILIATRKLGLLSERIDTNIPVYNLKKKSSLDFGAFYHLLKILKENKIDIVHAHGTSIIWATIAGQFTQTHIIWHDHYGNSEMLHLRKHQLLQLFSKFWSYTITVNALLEKWAIQRLRINSKKVAMLNNFATNRLPFEKVEELEVRKKLNNSYIVCVANLRPQKDHLNLLKAFTIVATSNENVELHLIGVDSDDEHARMIKEEIEKHKYKDKIIYWGARQGVFSWLKYMDIGVLPSKSEGLPVAVLEYAVAGIPVVVTEVGELPRLMAGGEFGAIVPPREPELFAQAILKTLDFPENAIQKANLFKTYVEENFSEQGVINKLINIYDVICVSSRFSEN
jgi:glycosyltransferase involved in cell wall biosynthesis